MLISDQLKANKTAYAEYLLQQVIQYFVDDDDEASAEYWTNMWIHDGAEKTITAFYVEKMGQSQLDDLDTTSWYYGVDEYVGGSPMDFESWMVEEGRLPTPPTPPLPQQPLHFRILYGDDVWSWTCEEEAVHPGNFITTIIGAHATGAPVEFVAYASTDAEADYIPVTIDWNSPYMDSDVLVLTGVPQILGGVRYSSTFAIHNADHYASLKGQVPMPN